jgi:hypothetical protein
MLGRKIRRFSCIQDHIYVQCGFLLWRSTHIPTQWFVRPRVSDLASVWTMMLSLIRRDFITSPACILGSFSPNFRWSSGLSSSLCVCCSQMKDCCDVLSIYLADKSEPVASVWIFRICLIFVLMLRVNSSVVGNCVCVSRRISRLNGLGAQLGNRLEGMGSSRCKPKSAKKSCRCWHGMR